MIQAHDAVLLLVGNQLRNPRPWNLLNLMERTIMMIQIRIHGRGGQGAVLASKLLAGAAVIEGKYAQSFPMFGPERRGAPVQSFVRISDNPIRIRGMVLDPDIVIVLDRGLIEAVDVAHGLKRDGIIILNSDSAPESFSSKFDCSKIASLDAKKIALEILGKPIVNTCMLGAFSRATGLVGLESLIQEVKLQFQGELGERNARAITEAHSKLKIWCRG